MKIPQWVYTLLPMFKPEKINIGGTSMTVLPGDDRSKSISSAPELGDRVRDPITGFTGIVVVTANFLNGCVRCGVAPETLKDGLPQREEHFDQAQLEVVDKTVFVPAGRTADVVLANNEIRSTGGPEREIPTQRALPAPMEM